jgi:uncharacterized Zn-binding protein involved in type VI secretion
MPATVNVNFRTVVHAASDGVATAFPDVCKTPSPAGPVPIPYPNVAMSADTAQGSQDVKMDGNPIMLQGSNFKMSTGDEAGVAGGVVSGQIKAKAEFINFSFDVMVEGKPVPRLGDMMVQNKGGAPNTAPMPEVQPPTVVVVLPGMPGSDQQAEQDEAIELESFTEAER